MSGRVAAKQITEGHWQLSTEPDLALGGVCGTWRRHTSLYVAGRLQQ